MSAYKSALLRLVSPLLATDFVLVSSPRWSFKSVDELLAYVQKPGNKELSIGHWGRGSTTHIVGLSELTDDAMRCACQRASDAPALGAQHGAEPVRHAPHRDAP